MTGIIDITNALQQGSSWNYKEMTHRSSPKTLQHSVLIRTECNYSPVKGRIIVKALYALILHRSKVNFRHLDCAVGNKD
ncbi:MAG: hypothetical protein CMI00_06675 [Oceanospirillaceae bacterium]|nr:hypothetical protein [Oceanospirillaceae bacterium]